MKWLWRVSSNLLTGIIFLSIAVGAAGEQTGVNHFRLLDGFERVELWQAGATEDCEASVSLADGVKGRSLRLSYQFGAAGVAFARRKLPLDLSKNFEINFQHKGTAPRSTFEIKLIDESGANVWWKRFPDYDFPENWTIVRIRRDDISFAWGPIEDHTLKTVARIEFVVVGATGDKASVQFDTLEIRKLPELPAVLPSAVATVEGVPVPSAVDGNPDTVWTVGKPTDLTLDLGYLRELGGLTLRWAKSQVVPSIQLAMSENGTDWILPDWRQYIGPFSTAGVTSYVRMTHAFGRYVRLSVTPTAASPVGLIDATIQPREFGQDDNQFFLSLAGESPKGSYPRGFFGQQMYWTVVGAPQGGRSALLSEDGGIEPGPGAFSIEPFVIENGSVLGWAEGEHGHTLRDEYLPLPEVHRVHEGFALHISAHRPPVSGHEKDGRDGHNRDVVTRYRLVNTGTSRRTLTLALAIRPIQVNPPTQTLNLVGGATRIEHIAWDGRAFHVNGDWAVYPDLKPEQVSLSEFERAGFPHVPDVVPGIDTQGLEAPGGFASGTMYFSCDLGPDEIRDVTVVTVLGENGGSVPDLNPKSIKAGAAAAADEWRKILNLVEISGPPESRQILNSLKTALAHMLITRKGPALRPGPRSYARSWIRDGAMMSESFLRLGQNAPAIEFARWYAPYQFSNGKVPCCVDQRGADPVVENDSHGELIFLIAEIYRYTRDRAFVETMWPHADKAAAALNVLRLSKRTNRAKEGDHRALFGLLPPSISHEGYSDQPAYSFWDNFWGLKGLNDAAYLAHELGRTDRATEIKADAAEFAGDIGASVRLLGEEIGHVPGAADRKDFDPTSTTIALSPTGAAAALPRELLVATFEKAWSEFVARRDGHKAWKVYTPYEFRQVSAFVRLGEMERAHALLDFYLRDRRPSAWNQWSEIISRQEREPRFIGDLPHTWVGSDFIRAVLDLFAFADTETGSLVIGAGLPQSWLQGDGIRVRGLRSPYGEVSYTAREIDGRVSVNLTGSMKPPGGFILPPSIKDDVEVTFNGEPLDVSRTIP